MKAMILAAGFGERLKPLTDFLPKPLVPVLGKPLISYSLGLLKSAGIKEVIINLHHLTEKIKERLGDGKEFGIKILYSEEPEILGTGGGIKKAENYLDTESFIVINSDIIIEESLNRLIEFHKRESSIASMVLRKDKDAKRYGEFFIDDSGRLIRMQELGDKKLGGFMFTGVHIVSKKAFKYLPKNKKICIIESFYKKAFIEGKKISGLTFPGFWSDLGTIESYFDANMFLIAKKWQNEDGRGIFSEKFIEGEDVSIIPPVLIKEGVIIESGAKIGPNVIIGKETRIMKNASIRDSILWDGSHILEKERIKNSIISPYFRVKR